VATTTIVGDVVRQVAADAVSITVLLAPGQDPHAFQPSPLDAIAIEGADIVFLSGAGLETSLLPLLQDTRGSVVDLSNTLALREQQSGDDEEEGAFDPHVWFDPFNVIEWTQEIAQILATADPAHADAYNERAAAYSTELYALDSWIRDQVATLPTEKRNLVTDHQAFGYFADRYGFTQIGAVIPSYSTLAEPSARELAALEDAIQAASVPCLFVGTTIPAALAEQVAADTGTRIVFLYTGSLSEAGGPAATYLDLMRFDVTMIVEGLAGSP
jgi:ABC-type Zn uptake system ZnuABC Zn-binding protein ZnuA